MKPANDPEMRLRAWADALNAVADLQQAIVQEAEKLTMTDDNEWLGFYRSIVFGTLKTFPDRAKEVGGYQSALGLKHTATEALQALRKEAEERHK